MSQYRTTDLKLYEVTSHQLNTRAGVAVKVNDPALADLLIGTVQQNDRRKLMLLSDLTEQDIIYVSNYSINIPLMSGCNEPCNPQC